MFDLILIISSKFRYFEENFLSFSIDFLVKVRSLRIFNSVADGGLIAEHHQQNKDELRQLIVTGFKKTFFLFEKRFSVL